MEMIQETECKKIYQKLSASSMITKVQVIILGHLDLALRLIMTLDRLLPAGLEAVLVGLDRFKNQIIKAVILETLILIILHK
jgi:hypothetical protein